MHLAAVEWSMRFRSSGVEDVRKEAKLEALKALEKANSLAKELKPNGPPPSAVQALVGAIMAGAIAYVLYNFTIIVESSLDKQFVSSNYLIRQIKITTRTIINDSKLVETENKVNEEAKKGAVVPNPSRGLEGVFGAWCLESPVSPLSRAFPNTTTKSSVEG
ncbi:hypothetical protein SUGI_0622120 [Cryptomeria japonica]|nr:hypothetical protein SUGI_0622120 [Cryptomeria japonica]